MQELVQEGLSNLCRLCGEDDRECFDLFDDERQEEELLFKIEQSVRIAITQGDGLPTGICTLCHDKLTGYATFYQQCHDTQDRLQEFLSIECAMQKSIQGNQDEEATNDDDYDHDDEHNYEAETEEVYYYEEEGPDNGVEDMEVVEAVEAGAVEEADESYMITEIDQDNTEERSVASNCNDKEERSVIAKDPEPLHPSLPQLHLYESVDNEDQTALENSLGISIFGDSEKNSPTFRKEMDVLLCGETDSQPTVSQLSCCSEPQPLTSPNFNLQGEEFSLDQGGSIHMNGFPLPEDQQLPLLKSIAEKETIKESAALTSTSIETRPGSDNLVVGDVGPVITQLQTPVKDVSVDPQFEKLMNSQLFSSQFENPASKEAYVSLTENPSAIESYVPHLQKPLLSQSCTPSINVGNQGIGSICCDPSIRCNSVPEVENKDLNDSATILSVNASIVGAVGEIKFQRNMGGVKIVFPPTTAEKNISFDDLINLFSHNEVRQAFCAESKEEDIIQQLVQQGLGSEGVTPSGRASSLSQTSSLDLPNSLLSPMSSVCDSWSWEISQLLNGDENSNDGGGNRSELNTPVVNLPTRRVDPCNFETPMQFVSLPSTVPVVKNSSGHVSDSFDSTRNISTSEQMNVKFTGNFESPICSIPISSSLSLPGSGHFGIASESDQMNGGGRFSIPTHLNEVKLSSSECVNMNMPQRVFTPLQVQIPEELDSAVRMSRTLNSCNTYFEELSLGISPVLDLDPNVATVRVSCPPTENSQHSLFKRELGIITPIQTVEHAQRSDKASALVNSSDSGSKDVDCDIKEVSVDIIIDDGKTNWLKLLPDPTDEFIKKVSHKCFKCHICSKSFRFKFQVQRHIKTNHSTEKPYICAVCGATFSIKYYLTRHMKVHDSNNKFKCKDCNREFTRRYQLLEHEQSHKGLPRLKCDLCEKMFSSKSAFNVHRSICPLSMQSYICDICGKTYAGLTALNHHRMRHEPFKKFKCTMCESSFHTHWQLVKHTKRHASQGLYLCRYCSLAFNTTTNLKKHTAKCPALTVNKVAKDLSTKTD
ncbi:uncharacterized protein LOC117640990 isoform X1 [Thrips palmi]|uniref:Uncharacterized protein LOC117640990 isoform X1 n=1 Tax=Thrips palmi TaxID=161013 RepID=A0A6P8YCB5_THRPL|nr:uncharacterized protein LOC117640990 isoform X1 [Thrips palmi]